MQSDEASLRAHLVPLGCHLRAGCSRLHQMACALQEPCTLLDFILKFKP